MNTKIVSLILTVVVCFTLCIPAIAAEIESDDYGTMPMVDVDSSVANDNMDELNDTGASYQNIEQLNEICDNPDSTMLDFICVTNPELFSELTEEDRIAFASMNYQDVLNGKYSPSHVRKGNWGGSCAVGLRFGRAPVLYYSMFFLSVTEGDWPYGRKCKLLVGTSQVIDCETNKVIAYQVETDTDADFLSISENSVTDIKSNCDYKNDVLVYGNDPSGVYFSFPFSNRDTSPDYGS